MNNMLYVGGMILLPGALAAGIINADFEVEAGSWAHGEGPPGWTLVLGSADQRGIVEHVDFAHAGNRAFRFHGLHEGFGDSRMDQCVPLGNRNALALSTQVRTAYAHTDLRVRLRVDFFTDPECTNDSANASAEQLENDFSLDPERFAAGDWVTLSGAQRLASALGDDVTHMRISLRARDRSDAGGPAQPPRVIWFDSVSLQATEPVLPAAQRNALRELYLETGGEYWNRQAGWLGPEGTECQWRGVHCNAQGDGIVRLDLANNNLTGSLPGAILLIDTLEPGGLDICWNDLHVADPALADALQLGGDTRSCLQSGLTRFNRQRAGALYQSGTRSGEAVVLHMLSEGSAVVYWLTYDQSGDPLWLFGTGRVFDRIMYIDEVFHARRENGTRTVEHVGRATLVFVSCDRAEMRFEISGDGYAAAARRRLTYLAAPHDPCSAASDPSGTVEAVSGTWYDPAQSGEGFGLTPNLAGQIFLTWMTYGNSGHEWLFGVGDFDDDHFYFDEIFINSGGVFEGDMSENRPLVSTAGSGELDWVDGQPRFRFVPAATGVERVFDLHRLDAGPELLASSGSVLHLEMSAADAELLYNRDPLNDERLPGLADYGSTGQVSPVALRFRGNTARQQPKKSFNIQHEVVQPLLRWSDRMNLNAMYADPAMMRQTLAMELFAVVDQPAPRTRYLDFWFNGNYEGLYVHVDRVDEHLLTANGLNPNGTLVRDEFRSAKRQDPLIEVNSAFGFDIHSIAPEQRADFLAARFDSRNSPDWEKLAELVTWVNETPAGPAYAQGFIERIDIDNFIDWLVLHWLVGDVDAFGDDYWLYLDHQDPDARWMFIPWDKDLTFGSHTRVGIGVENDFFTYEYALGSGWDNRLVSRFLATPALRDQAYARLLTLIAEVFPYTYFEQRVDRLSERIEDSVSIQPGPAAFHLHTQQHHSAQGRFRDHAEVLLDFMQQRYRYIDRQLNPIAGEPYQATADVQSGSHDPVFLTDAGGYTLMSIEPLGAWPENSELTASIVPDVELRGINRVWTLHSSAELGTVRMTLYYRNDTASSGRDNWWTEGANQAVGDQDRLQLFATFRGNGRVLLDTRINPYSNKAVTQLDLGSGTEEFILILPD